MRSTDRRATKSFGAFGSDVAVAEAEAALTASRAASVVTRARTAAVSRVMTHASIRRGLPEGSDRIRSAPDRTAGVGPGGQLFGRKGGGIGDSG
ncbi:hypothetical protein GCM10010372_82870 [Streptomyces tauricus]|nr:hypothetical protein GCM10010372_82870 [Streptomyces tauricus]